MGAKGAGLSFPTLRGERVLVCPPSPGSQQPASPTRPWFPSRPPSEGLRRDLGCHLTQKGQRCPRFAVLPPAPRSSPEVQPCAPALAAADPAATLRLALRVFRLMQYTQRWCFCLVEGGFFLQFRCSVWEPGCTVQQVPAWAVGQLSAAPVPHPLPGAVLVPVLLWELGSTQGWAQRWHRLCSRRLWVTTCGLPRLLLTCSLSQQSSAPSLPLPWGIRQILLLPVLWCQRESWVECKESKAVAGSASRRSGVTRGCGLGWGGGRVVLAGMERRSRCPRMRLVSGRGR